MKFDILSSYMSTLTVELCRLRITTGLSSSSSQISQQSSWPALVAERDPPFCRSAAALHTSSSGGSWRASEQGLTGGGVKHLAVVVVGEQVSRDDRWGCKTSSSGGGWRESEQR